MSEPRLLTCTDLAERFGVPVSTIHDWNYHRKGPKALKLGKHLRFRPEDVERWLKAQEVPV